MPLTFPAHAAAILPIQSRMGKVLPPVALVVGTCIPDLPYALGMFGGLSHTFRGVFLFCLPAGLIGYLWTELLLLPALRLTLPTTRRVQWGRFAASRGLPTTPGGWLAAAAAILIGAVTHVLWDGLTHANQWPARSLYAQVTLEAFGSSARLVHVLQHASSVLGSALVGIFLVRHYPSLPPARAGSPRGFALLVLATMAGSAINLAFRKVRYPGDGYEFVWLLIWVAVGGGLATLTLACVVITRAPWAMTSPRER